MEKNIELPMFANSHSPEVFGTFAEMRWVMDFAYEAYGNTKLSFVFVSQKRQIIRAKFIRRFFFSKYDPITFLVSGQTEEISLVHEFLAYSKLVAIKLGLGSVAERFRRFTTKFTKW